MAYERFTDRDMFYIASDGNWGGEDIIVTSFSEFTDEQIETLESLPDNDRFWYVHALLNGEDVSEFEDSF